MRTAVDHLVGPGSIAVASVEPSLRMRDIATRAGVNTSKK
jgi:hypothetical protein